MDLFHNLRELRIEQGLTQKELARQLSLSANIICEWEKGRCLPSIESLKKLSSIFECSIDFLVGNSDDFGNITVQSAPIAPLPNDEQALLDAFRKLPDDLKHRATAYMNKLVELGTEEKQTFTTKNTQRKKTPSGKI